MRKTPLAPGEHYHIYGRGALKQTLYKEQRDYARFLYNIIYGQSSIPFNNTPRFIDSYIKTDNFNLSKKQYEEILNDRSVKLIAFSIMPNHFHLLVEEVEENGISQYMHKVGMAYAKYFNTKYKQSGHVFQGPFGATHIITNEQLLYVSAYIHKNPKELKRQKERWREYQWSSFQDYVHVQENRWEDLLDPSIVLEQFDSSEKYADFVQRSSAKELKELI